MQNESEPSASQQPVPSGKVNPSPRSLPLIQVLFGSTESPVKSLEASPGDGTSGEVDLHHPLQVYTPSAAGNVCMSPTTPKKVDSAPDAQIGNVAHACENREDLHRDEEFAQTIHLPGKTRNHLFEFLWLQLTCCCCIHTHISCSWIMFAAKDSAAPMSVPAGFSDSKAPEICATRPAGVVARSGSLTCTAEKSGDEGHTRQSVVPDAQPEDGVHDEMEAVAAMAISDLHTSILYAEAEKILEHLQVWQNSPRQKACIHKLLYAMWARFLLQVFAAACPFRLPMLTCSIQFLGKLWRELLVMVHLPGSGVNAGQSEPCRPGARF